MMLQKNEPSLIDKDERKKKAGNIILAYSTAHATAAAFLANTIVGDAPVLATLTSLMIYQLAKLCDKDMKVGTITALAGNLFGAVAGVYLASKLIIWIPFLGNALNASITFGITQVVGWAAFAMFDEGLSKKEAIEFGKAQKISKEEMDAMIGRMSYDDRSRYDSLKNRLTDIKVSDEEKENIISEMAELIEMMRN